MNEDGAPARGPRVLYLDDRLDVRSAQIDIQTRLT